MTMRNSRTNGKNSIPNLGLVTIILWTLTGCAFLDGDFHEKKLTGFGFAPAHNPGLKRDYRAVIDEANKIIRASIPDYMDPRLLVADFTLDGARLNIGSVEQQTGVTVNDFTKPLRFSVIGYDDSLLDYELEFTVVPPSSEKAISLIGLWDAQNGQNAPQYTVAPATQETLILLQPPLFSALSSSETRISLDFTTSGVEVLLGGKRYSSGDPVDLSTPVDFTVVAEDGSTRIYTLIFKNSWISSFTLQAGEKVYQGIVDEKNLVIRVSLPLAQTEMALATTINYKNCSLSINGGSFVNGSVFDYSLPLSLQLTYSSGTRTYKLEARSHLALSLPSGKVTAMAVSGNDMAVGTENDGIYLSRDAGLVWLHLTPEHYLPSGVIRDLVIQNGALYASTDAGVVYASDLAAPSFRVLPLPNSTDLLSEKAFEIACDDQDLFAADYSGRIYAAPLPLTANSTFSLVLTPAGWGTSMKRFGDTVYLRDGASIKRFTGMTPELYMESVWDYTQDYTNAFVLQGTTVFFFRYSGLYSRKAGNSARSDVWILANGENPTGVQGSDGFLLFLFQEYSGNQNRAKGLISTDGGVNFEDAGTFFGIGSNSSIVQVRDTAQHFFAATETALYRKTK